MKTIRKIMEGVAAACISVAMYYCFLSGAPAGGTERTVYMILDGIFCISAWVAGVGILWYVRWLRRRNFCHTIKTNENERGILQNE